MYYPTCIEVPENYWTTSTTVDDFDLNENSIVFDVGSYKGEYYQVISKKYNCSIHAFEPMSQFYKECSSTKPKKVILNNFALGNKSCTFELSTEDNASSEFFGRGKKIQCKKVDFNDYLDQNNITKIDLLKLNIEGGEYELLSHIIYHDNLCKIDNILIQFHYLEGDAVAERKKIIDRLSITHEPVFNYPFVWEHWKLKK